MIHSFSVEVAKEYSVDKAIILHNFYFWVKENQANKRNIYKGKAYTYNTAEAFAELFPYLKPRKIAELLRDMEYDGLIESIQNKGTNRVKSYTLTDKGWSFYTTVYEASNRQNNDTPSYEIPTMEPTEIRLCSITDNKHTDNKHTDNNNSNELLIDDIEVNEEKVIDHSLDDDFPIMEDLIKEPKKTKKKSTKKNTNLKDDSFYKPIYDKYREVFFARFSGIPNCGKYKDFTDKCIERYREMNLSDEQIQSYIINAIQNSAADKFLIEKRLPFAAIVSEAVMPRLVSTSSTVDKPKFGVDFNNQDYREVF